MIISSAIGIIHTNCYLVYDEDGGAGVIVDPGGDPAPLLKEIEKRKVNVRAIFITHAHFDHIAGNACLEALNAPFALHPADRDMLVEGGGAAWFGLPFVPSPLPTLDLTDGRILEVGRLHFRVIHTPGHTPGSVCLYVPEENALLTGDTLFAGSVGRTDLPAGDARALTASLKRLLTLPPETVIYPGHGPTSTLGEERRSNPWLRMVAEW